MSDGEEKEEGDDADKFLVSLDETVDSEVKEGLVALEASGEDEEEDAGVLSGETFTRMYEDFTLMVPVELRVLVVGPSNGRGEN